MGTLRKLRMAMKTDRDLRRLMVRGSHNEILLDLDGDKEADIALQSSANAVLMPEPASCGVARRGMNTKPL